MAELIAPKRLVIVGATGMVGGYALRYALNQAVRRRRHSDRAQDARYRAS